MIEVAVKVFATIFAVGSCAGFCYWLWTTPLDVKAFARQTVARPIEELKRHFPSKDQRAIYQGDVIVAKTRGDVVKGKNGLCVFPEIYDSQRLDLAAVFEYRGKTFMALGPPQTTAGLGSQMTRQLIERLPCKELR